MTLNGPAYGCDQEPELARNYRAGDEEVVRNSDTKVSNATCDLPIFKDFTQHFFRGIATRRCEGALNRKYSLFERDVVLRVKQSGLWLLSKSASTN